jgi:hypothetical protein
VEHLEVVEAVGEAEAEEVALETVEPAVDILVPLLDSQVVHLQVEAVEEVVLIAVLVQLVKQQVEQVESETSPSSGKEYL